MTRKRNRICILILVIAVMMVGCNLGITEQKMLGRWTVDRIGFSEMTVPIEEFERYVERGGIWIDFEEDKQFVLYTLGTREEGTYSLRGEAIILRFNGSKEDEDALIITYDKGTHRINMQRNGLFATFQKER